MLSLPTALLFTLALFSRAIQAWPAEGLANFLPAIIPNNSYVEGSGDNAVDGTVENLAQYTTSISELHVIELKVRQTAVATSTTGAATCPANYNGCTNYNEPGVCCTNTAFCTVDSNAHLACCPSGKVCTGTVAVSTISGAVVTSYSGLVTATGTGNFQFISTIQNAYFLFPVIPSTYANAAVCSTAYNTCQVEYSSCLVQLGATSGTVLNGVTISASNGGTTVTGGAAATTVSDGASICSSLSSQACQGLQSSVCAQYAGPTSGSGESSGSSAAPTGSPIHVGYAWCALLFTVSMLWIL